MIASRPHSGSRQRKRIVVGGDSGVTAGHWLAIRSW